MAEVIGFKGLRYSPQAGGIGELCCPPYDIISETQRADYIKRNQNNIIRLELPKEGADPYKEAADILNMWKKNGIILRDDTPALYVYEEEFTVNGVKKSVKGVIARVKLEEFSKGIILPHEFTLSKAKEDRLNLMKATNCNFSQIYALYMDETHTTLHTLEQQSESSPKAELTDDDGVTHRLWIITDKAVIDKITEDFKDRKLYIADGHHRYETALNYRNYLLDSGKAAEGDACDYQMIYLVDMEHPGLVVLPTHRLVRGLSGFEKEETLKKCREYFSVEEKSNVSDMESILSLSYNRGEKAFGFYCGGESWYLLTLKSFDILNKLLPDVSKASRELDVTVLHTLILEGIFGIDKENMANQINLTYTKSFSEAVDCVNGDGFQCAFIMNPTRVTEIRDVAMAGEKMPQKSTYFYPKMITGLVMNELSD